MCINTLNISILILLRNSWKCILLLLFCFYKYIMFQKRLRFWGRGFELVFSICVSKSLWSSSFFPTKTIIKGSCGIRHTVCLTTHVIRPPPQLGHVYFLQEELLFQLRWSSPVKIQSFWGSTNQSNHLRILTNHHRSDCCHLGEETKPLPSSYTKILH